MNSFSRSSKITVVGAGAVVPNRMTVPSGTMALGVPAKIREAEVDGGGSDMGSGYRGGRSAVPAGPGVGSVTIGSSRPAHWPPWP